MYLVVIEAFDVAEVELYDWKLAAVLGGCFVCLLIVRISDTNSCKGGV